MSENESDCDDGRNNVEVLEEVSASDSDYKPEEGEDCAV